MPCVSNSPSGKTGRKRADSRSPPFYEWKRLGLGFFDELYGVANREDGIGGIVRNFNAELFFEGHDKFDGVERVRTEVIDEAGALDNLVGVDAKMINNNFLHAFCDIAHVGFLDLMS